MNHLVIIDGHHLMYRAYWAIPRTLKTSSGEQVNTVFGVASMLIAMLSKEEPDGLLVCFDEGEETFRHEAAEDYKEGRAETPDDFYDQIPRVLELVDAFGFHHVSDPKFEADDLICAYAKLAEKQGTKVTIVSGDRDLFQLASDKVTIVVPHKGYQQAEYLNPDGVMEKLGVRPDQVASYKGLCGDSSDNLPGVNGIGPKGASELLGKYETLEGIYKNLDDIRPKVREKLERDKEQAFFCEKMATLISDMPLPVPLKELDVTKLPTESIVSFLKEMEFTLLLKRLQQQLLTDFGSEHFEEIETGSGDVKTKKEQLTLF
ncbi:MAG: 5'-3' exonuclease H3TH domain-containing protein [Candidatus Peribacteraceae bacterium]|nr:5'-3' exonuclease H3TH domain-containing protein [Candidatus Peribacteraceae bacterium]MDP7454459.1 5'-3' exonuclease H3TH domain-containing protein [Candidatus Peribacteraceae bacterium]MDP7645946.1 5'-3' exonuclease H3TH domain-containing protein [Candidatus Peribacteraceae bacterium]